MPGLSIDLLAYAGFIERTRRRMMACREGVVIHDVSGGWMSTHAESEDSEFVSTNSNRVHWLATPRAITAADVDAAIDTARGVGRRRLFFMLGRPAWDESVGAIFERLGAKECTDVEYPALARATGECGGMRPTALTVRELSVQEVAGVLGNLGLWYSESGKATALRLVRKGIARMHGAFDGQKAVAVGFLVVGGEWAYLGAAGTDPAFRNRGAQTGLIASRLRRAAELGARWCACETNTAVRVSLNNLVRCGFEVVAQWRVYRWDERAAEG